MWCMAEGVGFEPTSPFGETVFKTAAFDLSAIPPRSRLWRDTQIARGFQLFAFAIRRICQTILTGIPASGNLL